MAKVRLFYRRKICYWLIVSVMILMTLNPSLQVIAKESVSDDLTVYTDAGESLELYARSAVLMDGFFWNRRVRCISLLLFLQSWK